MKLTLAQRELMQNWLPLYLGWLLPIAQR